MKLFVGAAAARAALFAIALTLAACGGGGGGGSSGGGSTGSFSLATSSVAFTGTVGGATPPARVVSGTISNVNSTVFLFVTTTSNGIDNATVQVTGADSGQLTIFPKSPSATGPGTFVDTISVQACLDNGCSRPIAGSPQTITVNYIVAPSSTSSGGGGGGSPPAGDPQPPEMQPGGGASPPDSPPMAIAASPSSVSLTAVEGATPAPTTVTVTNTSGSADFSTSISYNGTPTGWLSVTPPSGSSSNPVLTFTASALPRGGYSATVVVSAGNLSAMIPVSYAVGVSELTLSPTPVVFDINTASPVGAGQQTVAVGDTGARLNWTAASSVPWLTVSASGVSGTSATLQLVPTELAKLPNGNRTTTVTFSFTGPGSVSGQKTLPVSLALNLPAVSYVAPYVAYLNDQKEVVIRGSGFTQGDRVMFGDMAAAQTQVLSATEIRATPPALGTSQRLPVKVTDNLGVNRTRAELVVRPRPSYPFVAMPNPSLGGRIVYDAERDALIGGSVRLAFDSATSTWKSQTFTTQLSDVGLSPDGLEVVGFDSVQRVARLNPVTLELNSLFDTRLPNLGLDQPRQIGVTNDGLVFLSYFQFNIGSPNFGPSITTYSLLTNSAGGKSLPSSTATRVSAIDVSPDGSRAILQSTPPLVYTSGTGTIQALPSVQLPPGSISFNRNGTKLLSGLIVHNSDLSVFGTLPRISGLVAILAPDGDRAYALDQSDTNAAVIRIYDTTTSAMMLPELGTIQLPTAPGPARLRISLDGKSLFVVSDTVFIVQPLP